ncbi:MAG TPA: magnesium/cobalt transporter CorA [Candidatus Krumholzibacteria bacterium]|nr:magnesium/cobalt transporter CorA [Candidatus Krumholzibacteria bacterium]
MAKQRKHRRNPAKRRVRAGSPPGTLMVDPEAQRPRMQVLAYGPDQCVDQELSDLALLPKLIAAHPVTWVNVDGLGDAQVLQQLGEMFDLHRLALEDVVNAHQRAKAETYGDVQFIVLRMVNSADPLDTEQFSLFLGKNFVLTFQERPGDCLDPVRTRIRETGPRLRSSGPDYLAYALLDATVDGYFPVLERYGDVIEEIESEILHHPKQSVVHRLHELKQDLTTLRRYLWPLREMLSTLSREESPTVSAATQVYLRDCHDHSVQLLELLESFRELATSLMDLYHSSLSQRMNEVIKVLTMISTVFIPLSFIAGIYGMNFDPAASPWSMPELGWRWGYPMALGIMTVVVVYLLFYFRRKGWLGGGDIAPIAKRDQPRGH